MKMPKSIILKIFTIIGILCALGSLVLIILWFDAFTQTDNQDERLIIFTSHLPSQLHDPTDTLRTGTILSIIALFLSTFGMKLKKRSWKIINLSVLSIGGLMLILYLLWSLWSPAPNSGSRGMTVTGMLTPVSPSRRAVHRRPKPLAKDSASLAPPLKFQRPADGGRW